MQLTGLRLTGFKSFVEPAELRIDPGLTGIVGPNGCGKSNLLEAIRWVMGESSPKSVRAGGMDDVIFAGTVSRPPREFAEVVLFGHSGGPLPPGAVADGDDGTLEIVRRIERGAGSAYRINGRDVRARDVALLFADAATGAHSPALVSQGRVAAIVGARPQERRALLEEAAGIAGLHARRRDAEVKLRATEANLERIAELTADMEARAGQLRRQARAAERYTRLSDAIRAQEARMIFARWQAAAAAADSAREEAERAAHAVAEAAAAADGAVAVQAAAIGDLARAREEATAARDADHATAAALSEARAEQRALNHRLAQLAAERARLDQERGAEDRLAREGRDAIAGFERDAARAAAALAAAESERPRLAADAALAADRLRDAEVALAEARSGAASEAADRRIAAAALDEARRRIARVDAASARIDAELASAGDEAALADAARRAHEDATAAIGRRDAAEAALAAAEATRRDAIDTAATADAARAEARAALAALEGEVGALDRSLAAGARDTHGVLADISVEPGYEIALAAALGDDLGAPLVGNGDAATRGWLEPAHGAAPRSMRAAASRGAISPAEGSEPSDRLLARVSAPGALHPRLRAIIVAQDDDGRRLEPGERLVTLGGRLRRWDGFVSAGDGAAAAERLARINRRAEIAAQMPPVRAGLASIEHAHRDAVAASATAETRLTAARRTLAEAETAARTGLRAVDAADAALARLLTAAGYAQDRRDAMAAEVRDARRMLQEAEAAVAALPDGTATAETLHLAEIGAQAARDLLASARDALAALDRRIADARASAVEAGAELRAWKARAGEAVRRLSGLDARAKAADAEAATLGHRPAALERSIAAAEAAARDAGARVAEAIAAERGAVEAVRVADTGLENAREALAAARETRAGAAARAEHGEARRIEMGRISGERFECPPPLLPAKMGFDAATILTIAEESAAHERMSRERERIGPVNLIAADELAALEAEGASLAAQAEELGLAVNRLRGVVGHLNREGRTRLLAAFEAVDRHFRTLFGTLFGGGAARLELVESDDPLEAGLEIMAQPPGKKLASLTLLSGGEQALTAVALIFALFLTNPAPICVLDEVDAPLDDANVDRFCDLLDRMARETATRYLIVTHNAVTMSRMHRLFGVTMVERGVSRLVSVDLGAAEGLLAAE